MLNKKYQEISTKLDALHDELTELIRENRRLSKLHDSHCSAMIDLVREGVIEEATVLYFFQKVQKHMNQ